MYATANLNLKMADICIRLQGRYFIKSTFIAGIKSSYLYHAYTFSVFCCVEMKQKKPEQNNVLKYCGHVGYKNGQLYHPKWLKSVG